MIKTQFTLYLVNRPGEFARVLKAFTAAKINIEGISIAERTDVSLVQLIVSNAAAARRALEGIGVSLSEQKVAVMTLANKPGAFQKIANRLARNRININYMYATTPPSSQGGDCSVVISANDLGRVEKYWDS